MSESFTTNPFSIKPDKLNPNTGDFLEQFAGVSKEDLKQSGIVSSSATENSEPTPIENPDEAPGMMSTEERERYENELTLIGEVKIKRGEKARLEALVKYLNDELEKLGKEKIDLGDGDWVTEFKTGLSGSRFYVNEQGELVKIDLTHCPVKKLVVFENFKYLKTLWLDITPLEEVDASLPKSLQQLSVASTQVSKVNIDKLPVGLSYFNISFTPFEKNRENVRALRRRLTDCDVRVNGHSFF